MGASGHNEEVEQKKKRLPQKETGSEAEDVLADQKRYELARSPMRLESSPMGVQLRRRVKQKRPGPRPQPAT
jgi:hypothetical protein